jgi:hypothetical protein
VLDAATLADVLLGTVIVELPQKETSDQLK